MSETVTKASGGPQTQKERWVKYGLNVGMTIIIVILLAGAVTYLAQKFDRRIDTTATGLYSLKPQTINLIKEQSQRIKLVSLYAAKTYDPKDGQQHDNPYAGPVRDLLQEYARKGKDIAVETIDPVTQPALTDELVGEVVQKYGGAVKAYKDFIGEFQKTQFPKLKELIGAEAAAVAGLGGDVSQGDNAAQIVDTIQSRIPEDLNTAKERLNRRLRAKYPDYKSIVDGLKQSSSLLDSGADLTNISSIEGRLVELSKDQKVMGTLPPALHKYLSDSAPRHEAIKKLADETIKKIDSLGELKVGELQQAIKGQDIILVLGDNDWRVINSEQVWVADTRDLRGFTEGQTIKPRFAGEQAVTTAILSLSNGSKPKVVFVRAGGAPLTTPGFPPFQRGGPLSDIAERLRGYNFDVLEKDLSGMWAMQSQMQQMPSAPEPSDEQIKDALWIVVDMPGDQRMGPSPTMSPKLMEHLSNGGSALILGMPQADNLSESLKPYGIEMLSDAVIVHDVPRGEHAETADLAEQLQRLPFVFVINKYGRHLLTQPLQSLDALLVGVVPVRINPMAGVTQTPLLPIPDNLPSWGERDIQSIGSENPKFNSVNDVAPPLWAGAAAEKGKSRVVVLGGVQSFTNQIIGLPDAEMAKRGVVVARFPGNGELFTDAIFWLNRMEPMIAISPAAMEVSRIAPMSDTMLAGWRVGVLLILLPGLVLAAGISMYFARRD